MEINPDKQDLPEGFSPLLGSDTQDMVLNDGHLLESGTSHDIVDLNCTMWVYFMNNVRTGPTGFQFS